MISKRLGWHLFAWMPMIIAGPLIVWDEFSPLWLIVAAVCFWVGIIMRNRQ